jgi:hypothetical protein
VEDSEFVPSNPSATIDGLATQSTAIHRANIHGSVDGVKANSNTLMHVILRHNTIDMSTTHDANAALQSSASMLKTTCSMEAAPP